MSLPGAPHPVTFKLTQAELAQGNVNVADHGCWLQVLNKALDILIVEHHTPSRNHVRHRKQLQYKQTDMGWLENGTNREVVQWLTDRKYTSVFRTREKDWHVDVVRKLIERTVAEHLPICLYTSDHSLSIVEWNPQSDMVTVMNPWGTTGKYRPKKDGEEFQMDKGKFTLTVRQLMDNFRGINFPRKIVDAV